MEKLTFFFNGLKTGFKKPGHLISNIINTILLLFVFLFGIGIISLYFKIKNRDLLNLKAKLNGNSYWLEKNNRNSTKEDSFKPF